MIDDDLEALKQAARRMDDLFELPLADAPGLSFIGAKFRVELSAERCRQFSAGAADSDRQRAFRRCIGEAVETLAQFHSPRPEGQIPIFEAPLGLDGEEVSAMERLAGAGAPSAGWVGATRLHDGMRSSVPAACCFRDIAGDGESGPPLSLGCAAGRTLEAATLASLLELIERDAVALWWRGGNPATRSGNPELEAMVEAMRGGAAHRVTWFLDLTSDIGVPVAAAISSDREGGGIALGFAARATFREAAASAFLELAQMELGNRLVSMKAERDGLASLAPAEARQSDRLKRLRADGKQLSGGPGTRTHRPVAGSDAGETFRNIAALLASRGVAVHRVDLDMPGPGVPVVKTVAPLLQPAPSAASTERLLRARAANGLGESVVSPIEIL